MRDIHLPGRSVVMSTGAMVSTSQPMATAAGLEVLRRGGNAMDAAIAASATQCVTEPAATGIGGDCFLLYHEAKTDRLFGLNGSGRAPCGASREAYAQRAYETVPEHGIHAATVPGAVHAWQAALERFGTMGLDELLQPAIRYAQRGWAVTPVVAWMWQRGEELLASREDSARTLLIEGRAPQAGMVHRHPELASALRSIARDGARAFYQGEIAEEIVRFSKDNDGLFEMDDFADHESTWVDPISTDYRGHRVYELPPNGQGITALMILNILKPTRLGELEHLSADHVHLLCEAYKLALVERDRFVSDPEFNELPIEGLLSQAFAAEQCARIDPERALAEPISSAYAGQGDTIYLTVVDEDRNAVSFINSISHAWGSGVVAGNSGVLLQNRAAHFVLEEGHLNCIAPGKRSLHTIIPAMVYRDDRLCLSFGVMGGHYQPMGHSYVLSNWLDFGMDLQEAADAARFLPVDGEVALERGIGVETRKGLAARGHRLTDVERPHGGAQCIFVDWDNGTLHAASEPRKDGCALGY